MSQSCNKRRLHVGMRNFKTSLAVLVILVLYHFMGRSGFLASTTAIICMRDSIDQSVTFGMDRMVGTFIGAILGVGLYSLHLYLPFQRDYTHLMAPFGIMLLIALCNYTNKNDAIIMACVVFLAIILQENEASPLLYSINRLVDTLSGIIAALLINRFIKNPDRRHCAEGDGEEAVAAACEDLEESGIPAQATLPALQRDEAPHTAEKPPQADAAPDGPSGDMPTQAQNSPEAEAGTPVSKSGG